MASIASLHLGLSALTLSACAAALPAQAPVTRGPVVIDGVSYAVSLTGSQAVLVQREGRPFANWEGMEARRAADRFCNGRANVGIRDRFKGDGWLIVGGCA